MDQARPMTQGDGMTQFGRSLHALNIDILCANTPQAKSLPQRRLGAASSVPTKPYKIAWSRSEERRVGKECRSQCDWSSDVCSSDLIDILCANTPQAKSLPQRRLGAASSVPTKPYKIAWS